MDAALGNDVRLLGDAVRTWLDRDAFQHASALAFYTLFSLAPLMIILVAIIGMVYGEEAASGEIFARIRHLLGNQAAAAVEEAVSRSHPAAAGGLLPTLLGVGALLFGATTVFAQMQSSLNQFWDVRARPSRSGILAFIAVRLLSLGMVIILGFLLLISFAVSVAIAGVIEYAGHWVAVPPLVVSAVDLALSLLVTTAVFGMLFRVLPDVRLQWSDVWRGALFTAVTTTSRVPSTEKIRLFTMASLARRSSPSVTPSARTRSMIPRISRAASSALALLVMQ